MNTLLNLLLYGRRVPPLLLRDEIVPTPADWTRANKLFDHVKGCRCSTCSLAATLGHEIRRQEGLS